ncbi:MAG: cytochrome c1 [Caulobacterales bacterium]|nr:cytochrome c1 [Caulobacterales bacterium]
MTSWLTRAGGSLFGSLALFFGGGALAAEGKLAPEHHHWHHAGPFGVFDRAQLQRGFQVYRQVCAVCHGLEYLSFRNLGQKGGPFYDADYPNPGDNPVIRALAAEYMITDGPDEGGDMFERPGRPSDSFPDPFANDQVARLVNNGALPPDLSVITKARHHGADYLRSLLLGYGRTPEGEPPRLGLYYNPWFEGGQIAMAPPLIDGMIEYAEGQPPATIEQQAEDVVAFLAWAADPHQEQRKQLGFITLAYLSLFAGLMWLSYKQVWSDVKH